MESHGRLRALLSGKRAVDPGDGGGPVAAAAVAEDLTQETFLRAWQHYSHVSQLPPPARRAWLVRTVRNLATDAWRRQTLDEAAPSASPAPEEPAELRLDVAQALAQLPPEDRDLVVMRYLEEMNSREIGEALGVPEGTVRRRLAECRERLAQHLSQWAPEGARA